jgi:hypothetical protein
MKSDEERMQELSDGVQKIFRDAVIPTPPLPVESGNRGIDLQIESEYLPYLTLLSTSQEGRKGRSEFHGKEKGGPN